MSSRMLSNVARAAARRAAYAKSAAIETRGFVSVTTTLLEKHTMMVPTMGDSITEGTIVEWTASIGQMVKEGDVIALVETDKVTVDIKADIDGVITQQFGAVDDTVEVGAQLYEIDTDAEATVAASDASPAPSQPAPAAPVKEAPAPVAAVVAAAPQQESHRTPSIQFLGKEGWNRILSGHGAVAAPTVYAIPSNYGRPKFSEDEMEALIMGGANLAPDVKQHSSGAVFRF